MTVIDLRTLRCMEMRPGAAEVLRTMEAERKLRLRMDAVLRLRTKGAFQIETATDPCALEWQSLNLELIGLLQERRSGINPASPEQPT